MSCNEQSLRTMIFDYVDGNLDHDLQEEMRQHLKDCPECFARVNELKESIKLLSAAMFREASRHISNEHLTFLAEAPENLPVEERESFELHVDICTLCNEKLEMLTNVNKELNVSGAPEALPNKTLAARMMEFLDNLIPAPVLVIRAAVGATAIAIIAISVITFQADDLVHQTRLSFSNNRDLPFVPVQTRAGVTIPTFKESKGSVELSIYVEPIFSSKDYKLEIRGAERDLIVSALVTKEEYIPGIGISLRLTTSDLPVGRYFIIVIGTDRSDGRTVSTNSFPFDLER